eukprot:scaffold21588_cov135-Isochrysis_galbana.AAC.5
MVHGAKCPVINFSSWIHWLTKAVGTSFKELILCHRTTTELHPYYSVVCSICVSILHVLVALSEGLLSRLGLSWSSYPDNGVNGH